MSHLRTKLEHAARDYQAASYPGNLALDVLGPVVAKRRWNVAPLAIAAALAIGLSVGIFAGRFSNSSTTPETIATSSVNNPVTPAIDIAPKTLPRTDIASTGSEREAQPQTAVAGAFTVVPSANTFTGRSVSVVPDLATLETTDDTTSDVAANSTVASANQTSNAFVPMSLMLLSASEYGDQQQAASAAKTKTNTATNSEERS